MRGKAVKGQVTFEFIITIIVVLLVFVAGMAIFQGREAINYSSSQSWAVQALSYRLARNINSAYLLDENSSIMDTIIFNKQGLSLSVSGGAVAFYGNDFFVDAPLSTSDVSFLVTDFNGPIYFKKVNGRVVVSYS